MKEKFDIKFSNKQKMATLLGMSFSDEEVVAQSDVHLIGTTVETLIIEFDQAKFEKALSSGSFSPKAMRKIHKVAKETKAPTVAPMPKEDLSFGPDYLDIPSSDGVGSASAKPAPRRWVSGRKMSIEATKALKQAKKNADRRRRRSLRRAHLREC